MTFEAEMDVKILTISRLGPGCTIEGTKLYN